MSLINYLVAFIRGSRKFCNGAGGGPDFFKSSTYFIEGRTDLHREAIGPDGSNCFSRGVRTSSTNLVIFK